MQRTLIYPYLITEGVGVWQSQTTRLTVELRLMSLHSEIRVLCAHTSHPFTMRYSTSRMLIAVWSNHLSMAAIRCFILCYANSAMWQSLTRYWVSPSWRQIGGFLRPNSIYLTGFEKLSFVLILWRKNGGAFVWIGFVHFSFFSETRKIQWEMFRRIFIYLNMIFNGY